MLSTTIIILSSLVAINFILLIFSCNKSTRRVEKIEKKPTLIIHSEITTQSVSTQLAPTGS